MRFCTLASSSKGNVSVVFTEETKVVNQSTGATRKTGYAKVGTSTYNSPAGITPTSVVS